MHEVLLILTLTGGLSAALVLGYITQRLGLSPIVGQSWNRRLMPFRCSRLSGFNEFRIMRLEFEPEAHRPTDIVDDMH